MSLIPRGAHPRSGAMLVLVQVSSMKTSRSGSTRFLILGPLRPPPCDVGTIPFPSHYGFFLKLNFSAWTNSQTER